MHPLTRWLLDLLPARLEEVAIVAPSSAAVQALRSSLVRSGRDLLGVHVVTGPGLARVIAERLGAVCPMRRPDPLEERALLRRAVAGSGELRQWARRFPSALRAVGTGVRDWQLAGQPTPATDASRWTRDFCEVADAFTSSGVDFATRPRLLELAIRALRNRQTAPLRRVALTMPDDDRERDLEPLLELLAARGVEIDRWSAEDRRPPATFHSAPDLENELREVARGCFAAAADGVPWPDLVVAVPRLRPYALLLRRAFAAESVPFTTVAESPLLLEPRGAACAHALRILLGNAPRQSWFGLLSSPLLRDATPPHELREFDASSREHYLRGRGPHVVDFAESIARTCPQVARALHRWSRAADAIAALDDRAAEVAACARFLDGVLASPVPQSRDAVCNERVFAILDAAQLAARIDDSDSVGLVATLVDELGERGMPILGATDRGVRIVEHREASACPARRMWLCGMAEGLVPGPGPGDAVLTKDDRTALGLVDRATDRELQRQSLERLAAHPVEQLHVTRPRQGPDGRAVGPSIWLAAIRDGHDETRAPAHPLSRARQRLDGGLCPRDLALTQLALDRADADALATIAGPRARHIYDQTRALESFEPKILARDGIVGPEAGTAIAASQVSVSALGTLGYCPQQHLFKDVFRLSALPPEPDPCELPRDKLGTRIHQVLEKTFLEFESQLRDATDCTTLETVIVARADSLLDSELDAEGGPLQREFPTLHGLLVRRWRDALRRALHHDLVEMTADGSRPHSLEEQLDACLSLPGRNGPTELHVRGRTDRIDALRDGGQRLIDFKTGRSPEKDIDAKRILRGQKPQLATYALMLAKLDRKITEIEVRSVRPAPLDDSDPPPLEYELAQASELPRGPFGQAFAESLGAFAELRAAGAFAPTPGIQCTYCDFRAACRRLHPPSAARVETAGIPELQRYRAVQDKSTRRPLLAPPEVQESR